MTGATTATRRATLVWQPLEQAPGTDSTLRFVHVGRLTTFRQSLFFLALGAALLALPIPSFLGWLNIVLSGFLFVGGVTNTLHAIDLTLDLASGRWRVVRGLRFAPARAEGPLSDFASLVAVLDPYWPDGGRWTVALYPRGSFRAYGLREFSSAEEAARFAQELNRRCGIAIEQEPPWRESERVREMHLRRICDQAQLADPPHAPCLKRLADGFQVEDRERYVRHVLRVSSVGIEYTMVLAGSAAKRPSLPWKSITQIGLDPKHRAGWVLRPDWRVRAQEWWTARCHELKRVPGPIPRAAIAMAFFDDVLRMPQRELVIYRVGHSIKFGDVRRLGEDLMVWLEAALIREWERHGGRNPQ